MFSFPFISTAQREEWATESKLAVKNIQSSRMKFTTGDYFNYSSSTESISPCGREEEENLVKIITEVSIKGEKKEKLL